MTGRAGLRSGMTSARRLRDAVDLAELRWQLDRLDRQGSPGGRLSVLRTRYDRAIAVLGSAHVASWASPLDIQAVRDEIEAEFGRRPGTSLPREQTDAPARTWPGEHLDLRMLGLNAAMPLRHIDPEQHEQFLALVTRTLTEELGESEESAGALLGQLRLLVADFDGRRWLIVALRTWRTAVAPYERGTAADMNVQHMARSAAYILTGHEEPVPPGL